MKNVYGILSIFLLFGCAQQVAPTGGPKDVTPPEVLGETPAKLTANFEGNRVEIEFDEYIKLQAVTEQVLISPPMLQAPSFQLKRKSLFVKFEQELAPNTTYTINFGEAIRDNNEGNILQNYTYVFSTGAHLDSMQVKGKLRDALTGEPEAKALVMLYKSNQDSLPLDTIPDYFTRTNDAGEFHIKNVADQPYKIFALKDENANYKFDVPSEKIGFLDSLILPFTPPTIAITDTTQVDSVSTEIDSLSNVKADLGSAIPSYDMVMFVEDDTTQFLKKAYSDQFGKIVFVYNRPVSGFGFSIEGFLSKKQWKLEELNREADTVTVWITDVVPDTMTCLISVDGLATDTVELVMKSLSETKERASNSGSKGKVKGLGKKTNAFGFDVKFNPTNGRSPKPGNPIRLVANHPILGFDITRLKLYEDSVRVVYDISSEDPALRSFDISYDWKPTKHYRLIALDSAFSDLYGFWNDTIETTFIATGENGYGTLSVNVLETPKSKVLIELISSSDALIERQSVTEKGLVQFQKTAPSTYSVDVILDLNDNGKWDSGRYSEKLQPEPIFRIKTGAEVRANWDFELEWSPTSTAP